MPYPRVPYPRVLSDFASRRRPSMRTTLIDDLAEALIGVGRQLELPLMRRVVAAQRP
jgi:hypothetical protein